MKKKSPLEKEVAKQLARIKKIVKSAEQQGFTFPKYTPPKVPSRVTRKTVERLKKIKPSDIYKKAKYTIPETGKVISGTKARELISRQKREARKQGQVRSKKTAFTSKSDAQYLHEKRSEEPKKMQESVDSAKLDEVSRVKALIESIKATYTRERGYLFPKTYFEGLEKKIDSLTVHELHGITEESILAEETTKFKDPLTGEIYTGLEGRRIEQYRDEIGFKHQIDYNTNTYESDNVLENIRDMIATWAPLAGWSDWFTEVKENDKNTLKEMLEGIIAEEGEEVVAQRCQDNAMVVTDLAQSILYDSGGGEDAGRTKIQLDVVRFHMIITGKAPTPKQAMEYHDLMESYEVL